MFILAPQAGLVTPLYHHLPMTKTKCAGNHDLFLLVCINLKILYIDIKEAAPIFLKQKSSQSLQRKENVIKNGLMKKGSLD